jgi:sugar lactone lactonase YvrE
MALREGVFRAREWGGELKRIATLDYDPSVMRANDGKCDALGRFWVGTIDETRTLHNAALYCIDARDTQRTGDLRVDCKISPSTGMTTANGLAWSPDSQTLYWADTPSHTVWAWDFDLTNNVMGFQRVLASFKPKPDGWLPDAQNAHNGGYRGRPDGATVDVQGNYWVAMFEGRRVCKFAPDGTLLAELATPLQCPTMVCFGGEDLKTLYVTSAKHHRNASEIAAFPLSGAVLSMQVDVAGLPVNFFKD